MATEARLANTAITTLDPALTQDIVYERLINIIRQSNMCVFFLHSISHPSKSTFKWRALTQNSSCAITPDLETRLASSLSSQRRTPTRSSRTGQNHSLNTPLYSRNNGPNSVSPSFVGYLSWRHPTRFSRRRSRLIKDRTGGRNLVR